MIDKNELNRGLTVGEKELFWMYDNFHRISYSALYNRWKMERDVVRIVEEELSLKTKDEKLKILDVGCSQGILINVLNRLYRDLYNIEFWGIDISPAFLETAKRWVAYRGDSNCFFKIANVENGLDFDQDSFNVVMCTVVLEHLVDPEKGLREIYRVLKSQGLAIVAVPAKGSIQERTLKFIDRVVFKGKLRKRYYAGLRDDEIDLEKRFQNGHGHISVRNYKGWIELCHKCNFKVEKAKRGTLFYGGPFFDRHPCLWGLIQVFDVLLETILPTPYLAGEIVLKLRK